MTSTKSFDADRACPLPTATEWPCTCSYPTPSVSPNCNGTCANVWPPLSPDASVTAGAGVRGGHLTSITRSDGSKQLTYYGHPLYRYVGDQRPGQTTGQGLEQFGGAWYLMNAAGMKIDSD